MGVEEISSKCKSYFSLFGLENEKQVRVDHSNIELFYFVVFIIK